MKRIVKARSHYLSSRKMTVLVDVNSRDEIVSAPPIVRKFVGQSLDALVRWMKKQGGFVHEKLTPSVKPGEPKKCAACFGVGAIIDGGTQSVCPYCGGRGWLE